MLFIKKILNLSVVVILFSYGNTAFAIDRELVWQDEFNYEGIPDPSKWDYEEGYVRNGEKQFYRKADLKTSRVENGNLVLEGHKIDSSKDISWWASVFDDDVTDKYISASLTTKGIQSWKYGYIEVRAKIPKGRGLWPAIWMLGDNKPKVGWPMCGELDIMEQVGYQPDVVHMTVHTYDRNWTKNNMVTKSSPEPNLTEEFHTYGMERSATKITFYRDGLNIFSYDKESDTNSAWPFDQPMYLILNLAIGGGWGGKQGIDTSIFPQQFLIDYVRVYK